MSQRPVDSHHPPASVFCSADDGLRWFFVEVTPVTPNPLAAAGWLVSHLGRFVPDEYEAEFDPRLLICVGSERWTSDSVPADGPGAGVRELWRFDVRQALTITR
jgi:hypothetical protein